MAKYTFKTQGLQFIEMVKYTFKTQGLQFIEMIAYTAHRVTIHLVSHMHC